VQNSTAYIIQYSLNNDCNPPLFYLIDGFSVWVFGATRFAERFPSVIAGILLIPTVYYLGKELKGDTLGLLSALAVATLGPMWYYSQFGRAYMLECLVFTVFCIYYLRLVRKEELLLRISKNWVMVVGCAVMLAYLHLYAIIPLTLLFLYLIGIYRAESIKWMVATFILTSPLLLLFNAILKDRAVSRSVASTSWSWYGATVPQIIIFAPLEFFGYSFVFWIPLIAYATYTYKYVKEVVVFVGTFLISFLVLLALADTTPVFIRYLILFVPVLVTIGLLPIADFVDNPDATRAQKTFVLGCFGFFYFAIVFYQFWSGLYMPKGDYFIYPPL
jgi:4-amino-4-deoxy-L-arabinose transferase-like glycosyltransferase